MFIGQRDSIPIIGQRSHPTKNIFDLGTKSLVPSFPISQKELNKRFPTSGIAYRTPQDVTGERV